MSPPSSLLQGGGPPAAIARDRNLLEEIRGGARPLIQLIRGNARVGQDAILLYGVADRAPAVMSASLPARVCIAPKHPVSGSQMQRLKDRRSYGGALSILSAVALGNRKTHEIATFLSRKATDLSPYLRQLMELGLLERQVPFDERYPERSKNGLYRVADNFMRFWFTYVHPFRGELEMGNMRPSKDAMCRTLRSKFVPFAFEEVSAEAFGELCRAGEVELTPSRIAGYWNRKGSVELDVCALDAAAPRAFAGECKYYDRRQVGVAEWRALVEKATQVPSLREREVIFGLFSHTGFSEELLGIARADDRLVLVNHNKRVA